MKTVFRAAFVLLLVVGCLLFSGGYLPAAALLYQWDFNGTPGTTVTPTVGSGGVLTMSQVTSNGSALSAPAITNLYSDAGSGVFGTTNTSDRAFNNSGTIYDINASSFEGAYAGMASSDGPPGIPGAMNNRLASDAGIHDKITITGWVKLDDGDLNGAQSRLIKFGSQNYDGELFTAPGGGPPTGVDGTYFGFYSTFGAPRTLQFKSNGAGGMNNFDGFVGAPDIITPFASDWMFVAVTYDSTITMPVGMPATLPKVEFFVSDRTTPLAGSASTGELPIAGTASPPNLNSAGPVNLNDNYVYIGNRINGPLNRGLGALIDDLRIYDGVLTLAQLEQVRLNQELSQFSRGDFDLNGVTNSADIPVMMSALRNLSAYQAERNVSDPDLIIIGDFNSNGGVDNADIQGLLNLLSQRPPLTAGDFDLSGTVDAADVTAMLHALENLSAYKADNNLSDADLLTLGDFNDSPGVQNTDIQGLLDLLSSGGGQFAAVPEPAPWTLLTAGILFLLATPKNRRFLRGKPGFFNSAFCSKKMLAIGCNDSYK